MVVACSVVHMLCVHIFCLFLFWFCWFGFGDMCVCFLVFFKQGPFSHLCFLLTGPNVSQSERKQR